ncbi:CPBP family intramembrane metalloprotease [Sphingorhabdus pulchriflava]|uniref:CPBP family intramembrane metalloprotease n=1 Tax=Sphingorhabdus pulchriflava TaxID=2292257 RepID=A0A371B4D9_9SPHN|nr:type II CAAX endopeptidase family protein [Sphingorhabdus pulchriflava]RDV02449.1 CPBP family intramembrane metalloprotease [Sphingorhabdus pulchriflava]
MSDRIPVFERGDDDFPYYNGLPITISGVKWLFVIAMAAAGFALLTAKIAWPGGTWGQFVPAILFFALPLAGLAIVAPQDWKAIFRKVGGREIKQMFGYAALNILVSMAIGMLVMKFFGVVSNSAVADIANLSQADAFLYYLKTGLQLFGEELISILPFLAILYLLFRHGKLSRNKAIIAAWILSAIPFALVHLPTYQWNWIQCLVVIGGARLVLTLAYIRSKNIWVSTGAHVLNDWTLFTMNVLGAGLATAQ